MNNNKLLNDKCGKFNKTQIHIKNTSYTFKSLVIQILRYFELHPFLISGL
jgi:hypothetical protein